MSRGTDTPVTKDIIAIETDDIEYWYEQLKESRKNRLKAKARKFRIFKGKLIEDIR